MKPPTTTTNTCSFAVTSRQRPSHWRVFRSFALCLLLLLETTGCSGPTSDNVGTNFRSAWIANHAKMATPYEDVHNAADRNEFIDEFVAIKNIQFHNLVKSLRRGVSGGSLAADGSRLILDGLAATTGGAAVKAGLAAASAGITGFSGSVKKDLLFDQALPSFFEKMEELRANKLADITRKKRLSITEYTRSEAYNDVEEYGMNGTFDAALRALNVQTGQSAAMASASLSREKGDDVSAAAARRGSGGSSVVPEEVTPRKTQKVSKKTIETLRDARTRLKKNEVPIVDFIRLLDEVPKLKSATTDQKTAIFQAVADKAKTVQGAPPVKATFDSLNDHFQESKSLEEQTDMQKTLIDQLNRYLPKETPQRSIIPQSSPPSLLPPIPQQPEKPAKSGNTNS